MAVGNVNLVVMGIATRNEEGVVKAVVLAGWRMNVRTTFRFSS